MYSSVYVWCVVKLLHRPPPRDLDCFVVFIHATQIGRALSNMVEDQLWHQGWYKYIYLAHNELCNSHSIKSRHSFQMPADHDTMMQLCRAAMHLDIWCHSDSYTRSEQTERYQKFGQKPFKFSVGSETPSDSHAASGWMGLGFRVNEVRVCFEWV